VKYLCLIYSNESPADGATEADSKRVMEAYFGYEEEISKAGIKLAGEALYPTGAAKTVHMNNGSTVTTDGPFAETKAQLGGFYLLYVKDEAEAIKYAAKIPTASMGGRIEVRPVMTFEQP